LKDMADRIEVKLCDLFEEVRSGISAREDSRAFGAMIERRITDNWDRICNELGYTAIARPGRRTIFDFAFQEAGSLFGIDVKTKDLDSVFRWRHLRGGQPVEIPGE